MACTLGTGRRRARGEGEFAGRGAAAPPQDRAQPVRLIGVGVSGLGQMIRQLSLWDAAPDEAARLAQEKEKRLAAALKKLREQYGDEVVWYGEADDSGPPPAEAR